MYDNTRYKDRIKTDQDNSVENMPSFFIEILA